MLPRSFLDGRSLVVGRSLLAHCWFTAGSLVVRCWLVAGSFLAGLICGGRERHSVAAARDGDCVGCAAADRGTSGMSQTPLTVTRHRPTAQSAYCPWVAPSGQGRLITAPGRPRPSGQWRLVTDPVRPSVGQKEALDRSCPVPSVHPARGGS